MTEKAIFGAGCFWGVEAAFRKLRGVKTTSVGYSGGKTEHPVYEEVCSGRTGHAEVVEIVFDPEQVSYQELLEVFWKIHDPTTLDRQGPDIGTQYRSAVFYLDDAQKAVADASKEELDRSGRLNARAVTEITAASAYHLAEDYHQQYIEKNSKKVFGLF